MWPPELRNVTGIVTFSSLFVLSILHLAIALPGLQTRQAGLVGRLGRAGFILAMIGAVPFSAIVAFQGISELFPKAAFSAAGGVGTWWVVLLNVVVVLAPAATLVGIAVFGIATARASVLPRWAAMMFALGWPIGIASAVIYSVYFLEARVLPNETRTFLQIRVALSAGLPIFALGLIRLGYALWAHARLKKNLSKRLPELSRPYSSRSRMPRTGFGDKTVWDWLQLLIVPIMLAVASFWFTLQQDLRQQATEEQRAQDAALQAHFDEIGELMLKENGSLRESEEGDEVNTLARSRTLTLLSRPDGDRKARVVQFLYEAHLIAKDRPVLELRGADLSEVSLNNADLRSADLSGANLSDANLTNADLSDAVLSDANLSRADLSDANLSNADVRSANLKNAVLSDANLFRADLSEDSTLNDADLSNADLSVADLSDAVLLSADLSEAVLRNAYLARANLSGANLRDADLRGADLLDAVLDDADLEDAKGPTEGNLEFDTKSLKGATMPDGSIHD
jgi:uncharacterized protein YjbI with pentapeptide repeats